jgi:NADH-quinone oxidoreductase subunit M
MPLFATFFVITALSSVGLPLLNGFIGEFLIMFGMWNSTVSVARPWLTTMLAATGVIWAAVYMLWMVQRVFFGRVRKAENRRLADLNWREIGLMLPLLALMLFMGAYPRPFLERSRASIEQVRARVVAGETQGVAEMRELK